MSVTIRMSGRAAALLLFLGLPQPAPAQNQSTALVGGFLIADYPTGYELRVPAGWRYDRARFTGPESAQGLLRGRDARGAEVLQIMVFRPNQPQELDAWAAGFAGKVHVVAGGPPPERRARSLAQTTAVELIVDAEASGSATRTHYLCVRLEPQSFWVLTLAGPAGEPANAQRAAAAEQLIGSLRLYSDAEARAAVSGAFERGRALVARFQSVAGDWPSAESPDHYEMVTDAAGVGYLSRQVTRETQSLDDPRSGGNVKEGLRIRERSWRFDAGGNATEQRVDLFASFDGQSELAETRITQVPGPAAPVQQPIITRDQVVRERGTLFSSLTMNLEGGLPDPRLPLQADQNYASLAWLRVLPGLLREAGEPVAFNIYDSAAGALVPHVLTPRGPLADEDGKAWTVEVREGFSGPASTLVVAEGGRVRRFSGGGLTLAPLSAEQVEERYGARRAAAQERVRGKQDGAGG